MSLQNLSTNWISVSAMIQKREALRYYGEKTNLAAADQNLGFFNSKVSVPKRLVVCPGAHKLDKVSLLCLDAHARQDHVGARRLLVCRCQGRHELLGDIDVGTVFHRGLPGELVIVALLDQSRRGLDLTARKQLLCVNQGDPVVDAELGILVLAVHAVTVLLKN